MHARQRVDMLVCMKLLVQLYHSCCMAVRAVKGKRSLTASYPSKEVLQQIVLEAKLEFALVVQIQSFA